MTKFIQLYPSMQGYEKSGRIKVNIKVIDDVSLNLFYTTQIKYRLMNGRIIAELFERTIDCERRYYIVKDIIEKGHK